MNKVCNNIKKGLIITLLATALVNAVFICEIKREEERVNLKSNIYEFIVNNR